MTRTNVSASIRSEAPSAVAWGMYVLVGLLLGMIARGPFHDGAGIAPRPRVPAPPPDLDALLYQLGAGSVIWYVVVLVLPLLVLCARFVNAERSGRVRTALGMLSLIGGGTLLSQLAEYRLAYADGHPPFVAWFVVSLGRHLSAWVGLVGVAAAIEWHRRATTGVIEHERLRAQVAEQRLIALSGQLHPHFLFNTLQGISTLIHRDPASADAMLAQLSDLLRDLLRHRDRLRIPLAEELHFARTYLELSQRRFADRLRFSIEAREDALAVDVPLFILQPLIENAITHGIGGRLSGGTITVRAQREGSDVWLEVADDGAGLTSGPASDGLGLASTRERLMAMYGDAQAFSLRAREPSGTTARVRIPVTRDKS